MIASWAIEETAGIDMGDKRLNKRLTQIVSTLGSHPNLSIPAACSGRAELEATYRFFDNDLVSFDALLQPHVQCTLQRASQEQTILLVQDTSEIDLTRPEQEVAGAGELDGTRRGLLLHEMQAFTTQGIPLGTVWAQTHSRTELKHSSAKTRHERAATAIEEKESMRWLEGLRQARAIAQQLPEVQVICVADSEADIYELFSEPRGEHPLHWLIRGCQDRALDTDTAHLFEKVARGSVLYEVQLKIRGRKAKVEADKRQRRQPRETREAQAEVRATTVTLRPPWRADQKLPEVSVNVVLVREVNPPPGEPAVEWLLITTLPIETLEQVKTIVEYYCIRWGIEIFFRTLKSGCRVEERRFEHIDRVERYLGVCLILGWRTMFVCHMGRSCPDMDCETIFEASEWKAVWVAVHKKKPPQNPPKLQEMVHLIGLLGGYVERPKSEPGPQTIWIGLQRMYDLAWAWEIFGPDAKIQTESLV